MCVGGGILSFQAIHNVPQMVFGQYGIGLLFLMYYYSMYK